MRIAIPTFEHRVSPRFDCAPFIVIVDIARGEVVQREALSTSAWESDQRIRMLVERGVNVVVCGGVDRVSAQSLVDAGVEVCSGVSGECQQALRSLLEGRLARQAAEEMTE